MSVFQTHLGRREKRIMEKLHMMVMNMMEMCMCSMCMLRYALFPMRFLSYQR